LAKELARVLAQNDRDLKAKDALLKTQEESFKYKLQYLELSQKDLKRERKTWQDKEQSNKKQIAQHSSELRELKAQLRQQVDIHDAYRQHVETKEAARSTEVSGWDMRKQALVSEHQLEIKRAESKQNSKIAQLEAELERVRADLENSKSQVVQLNEQLREHGGAAEEDDFFTRRSKEREEKKSKILLTPVIAQQEASTPEPQPTIVEQIVDTVADAVTASSSVEETSF